MTEPIDIKKNYYQALVIGVSAGGLNALTEILPKLPKNFPLAIVVLQHRGKEENKDMNTNESFLITYLRKLCEMPVCEALSLQPIEPGVIYIAPAQYHLLVEKDKTFSLSVDEPVNHSIPSIDVLFTSASNCYKKTLIGLVLTGASNDGSAGIVSIKSNNGLTLVQAPHSAEVDFMPKSAIKTSKVDYILPLPEIAPYLKHLTLKGIINESR